MDPQSSPGEGWDRAGPGLGRRWMSLVYCVCKLGLYAQSCIFCIVFAAVFNPRKKMRQPGLYVIEDLTPIASFPEALISALRSVTRASESQ